MTLLAALMLALAQTVPSEARPARAVQMDAIDTCLFTCDVCYKVRRSPSRDAAPSRTLPPGR